MAVAVPVACAQRLTTTLTKTKTWLNDNFNLPFSSQTLHSRQSQLAHQPQRRAAMANRPPLPSVSSQDGHYIEDPFADRPRQTRFQEPVRPGPYDSTTSLPRPFESTTSLPHEFGGSGYGDEEYIEKQPLTRGEAVSHPGGFYPPGLVDIIQ